MELTDKQKKSERTKRILNDLFYVAVGFIIGMMIMAMLVGRPTNSVRSSQIIADTLRVNISKIKIK